MSVQRKPAFAGDLIQPGDAGYERARRVWNGAVDRHPAFIARCRSTREIVDAIDLAHQLRLTVSIRASGHNYAGLAVWDEGLVIDLSPMKGVSIDSSRRTALVQPGVTWGEFDSAANRYGLATTGANDPAVGVAGSTLAGGLGWLHRVAGLSCDNLLSAEVVTAAGEAVRAAPDEHGDLFWALRGGGGNFGVVTALEYRLHPVGEVWGRIQMHSSDRAREVLRLYQEMSECAPDELFLRAMLGTAPPAPLVPDGVRGRPVVVLVAAYFGTRPEGELALCPLRELGTPAVELTRSQSYPALQAMFGGALPADGGAYARTEFLTRLTNEVIDGLVTGLAELPGSIAMVTLQQMGGAMGRVPEGATAFSHRRAGHHLGVLGVWPQSAPSEPTVAWVRSMWERAGPASAGGGYTANLMDEGEERVCASYGAAYVRLARIKARYDPDNFFRLNANIPPNSGASDP